MEYDNDNDYYQSLYAYRGCIDISDKYTHMINEKTVYKNIYISHFVSYLRYSDKALSLHRAKYVSHKTYGTFFTTFFRGYLSIFFVVMSFVDINI